MCVECQHGETRNSQREGNRPSAAAIRIKSRSGRGGRDGMQMSRGATGWKNEENCLQSCNIASGYLTVISFTSLYSTSDTKFCNIE